ncbi:hypothetical protein [Stenotrophomonas tuberculopleuritidis]|uniref:hypothetical protein n=1 Tax=Stenotrophomonas tuberculopleuritidis TaxID=3055079 RepID=UPI0026E5340A|nr:hypothetical protein [Stenotrophomonas sp. 704A1]
MTWPVSSPRAFAVVLLVLAGAAAAAAALHTLDAPLQASAPPVQRAPGARWEGASAAVVPATPRYLTAPLRANLLLDRDRLQAARLALENLPGLAGHRLTVFHSIHFHDDGRINLELVDPQRAGHVDRYHYERGTWRKGDPVDPHRFAPTISLSRSSTALASIDFDAVPRFTQAVQERRRARMRTPAGVSHVQVIVRKGGRLLWLPDDVADDLQTEGRRNDDRPSLQ